MFNKHQAALIIRKDMAMLQAFFLLCILASVAARLGGGKCMHLIS